MNLIAYLDEQRKCSTKVFGPGQRTEGLLNHISKEIQEVRKQPLDVFEWVDIAILALDGAWRAGYSSEDIAVAMQEKQRKNGLRKYPDWRTPSEDQAIEHIREESE